MFVSASAQYAIRTEGDYHYQFANDLPWSGGPGYLLNLGDDFSLSLQANVSGETKHRVRVPLFDDERRERTERFAVVLTDADGGALDEAVALGPEPVLSYCATAPMPEGLDELMLAGVLGKRRVELVKCVTVDLEVPANTNLPLQLQVPFTGAAITPTATLAFPAGTRTFVYAIGSVAGGTFDFIVHTTR